MTLPKQKNDANDLKEFRTLGNIHHCPQIHFNRFSWNFCIAPRCGVKHESWDTKKKRIFLRQTTDGQT